MAPEGRTRGRHAALGLVIVVHAVLVVLALRYRASVELRRETFASPLIFLTPSTPVTPPSTIAPAANNPKPSASSSAKQVQPASGEFAITLDTPEAPASDSLPLRLGIDWDQQAASVANSQAESIFKERKRVCDETARRGEEPPGCHRYRKPDAWSPEPKKFGFAGGLPFVRLSKRCVLGLGFFGCGVGKLPEADGHVLDDMRDPDRPRSSVPDANDRP
jgi:hypothetical protein